MRWTRCAVEVRATRWSGEVKADRVCASAASHPALLVLDSRPSTLKAGRKRGRLRQRHVPWFAGLLPQLVHWAAARFYRSTLSET